VAWRNSWVVHRNYYHRPVAVANGVFLMPLDLRWHGLIPLIIARHMFLFTHHAHFRLDYLDKMLDCQTPLSKKDGPREATTTTAIKRDDVGHYKKQVCRIYIYIYTKPGERKPKERENGHADDYTGSQLRS
jgi:hypothetical protein